ncbi:MAG: hypothetical protein IPL79_05800 [Myxococcales bacterium]|nr:hypothetical protein [Myxococcales bacterium]
MSAFRNPTLASYILVSASLLAAPSTQANPRKSAARAKVAVTTRLPKDVQAKGARLKAGAQKLAQTRLGKGTYLVGGGLGGFPARRDRERHIVSDGSVFRTVDISQLHPNFNANDLILAVAETDQAPQIAMFERLPDGALRKLSPSELKAHKSRRELPSRELLEFTIPLDHPWATRPPAGKIPFKIASQDEAGFDLVGPDAPANENVFQGFKGKIVGGGSKPWKEASARAIAVAMSKVSPIAMHYLKRVSAHTGSFGAAPIVMPSIEVALDATGAKRAEPIGTMVDSNTTYANAPGKQLRPMLRLYTGADGQLDSAVPTRLEIYALGTLAFWDFDHSAMSVAIALDAPAEGIPAKAGLPEIHAALVAKWKTSPAAFAKSHPHYNEFLEAAFSRQMFESTQPDF